jgi:multicomponent Na+:H+ antiporter subunit B
MSALALELTLLGLLVLTAALTAVIRDVLAATVVFAVYSLVLSLVWILLRAPDVALTEAAVGAGVVTVLLVATIAKTSRPTDHAELSVRWPSLAVIGVFAVGIVTTLPSLPAIGDPTAPIHQHLGTYYLETAPAETGVSNIVTAILAAYRAFDTFGEVVVVFGAGIGLLVVLRQSGITLQPTTGSTPSTTDPGLEPSTTDPHGESSTTDLGREPSVITTTAIRYIVPFVALFGLYIAFHGAKTAGGGFQGGVVVAASVVLVAFGFGIESTRRWLNDTVLTAITAGGVAAVVAIGLGAMALGGRFLEYTVYPIPKATTYGIELVELGIGATVTGIVLVFFFALVGNAETPPGESSPTHTEESK